MSDITVLPIPPTLTESVLSLEEPAGIATAGHALVIDSLSIAQYSLY